MKTKSYRISFYFMDLEATPWLSIGFSKIWKVTIKSMLSMRWEWGTQRREILVINSLINKPAIILSKLSNSGELHWTFKISHSLDIASVAIWLPAIHKLTQTEFKDWFYFLQLEQHRKIQSKLKLSSRRGLNRAGKENFSILWLKKFSTTGFAQLRLWAPSF